MPAAVRHELRNAGRLHRSPPAHIDTPARQPRAAIGLAKYPTLAVLQIGERGYGLRVQRYAARIVGLGLLEDHARGAKIDLLPVEPQRLA